MAIIAALEFTPKLIPDYFEQVNAVYNARLNLVHEKLHQIKGFTSEIPQGSFYYWANFSSLGINTKEMVEVLAQQNIMLSWGGKFGMPDGVRINCGAKTQDLAVICDAIVEFCRSKDLAINYKEILVPEDDLPKFTKGIS